MFLKLYKIGSKKAAVGIIRQLFFLNDSTYMEVNLLFCVENDRTIVILKHIILEQNRPAADE